MNDFHSSQMDESRSSEDRGNENNNGNDDSSEKRSPWDKFLARLRSVRLVKSAKKLRGLRNEANAWYPVLESELQAIQKQLDAATDPLDQAAYKEELDTANENVGKLDNGLEAINKRAKALVGDSEV